MSLGALSRSLVRSLVQASRRPSWVHTRGSTGDDRVRHDGAAFVTVLVEKWLVNAGGFTEGALTAMQEAGITHSGAAEINELLRDFGLQRLLKEAV